MPTPSTSQLKNLEPLIRQYIAAAVRESVAPLEASLASLRADLAAQKTSFTASLAEASGAVTKLSSRILPLARGRTRGEIN